jgi:hypothetical protein
MAAITNFLFASGDDVCAPIADRELLAGEGARFSTGLLPEDDEASLPESVSRRSRFKSVCMSEADW